jgi:hypothetical protein
MTQRLGRVQDQDAIASLLGRLSSQGVPGLQGQYGAATVQGIDAAFRGQQLFNIPDVGPAAMFTMFSKMGIHDPAVMNRMKNEGLMAHPEMWKPLFDTIEQHGGLNSIVGQRMAESFNIPFSTYPAIKRATTAKETTGYMELFRRVLGPEEADKLSFAKTPQMFNVAKQFQEREARGEFSSLEDERKQLTAALQQEGATMADELETRRTMVTIAQKWTDVVDLGVKSFTDLVGDKLPKFGTGLEKLGTQTGHLADVIERILHPFGGSPEKATNDWLKSLSPEEREKIFQQYPPGLAQRLREQFSSATENWTTETGKLPRGYSASSDNWTSGAGRLPRGYSASSRSIEGIEASPAVIAAIKKHARNVGLSFDQAAALAYGESRFDPHAKSHTGDFGLFQIHAGPAGPAPHLTSEQLLDPDTNASVALPHFARLLSKYGKTETAIAAYNRGEGRVPVGTDVERTWQPLATRNLIERHNEYLTGSVTVYLRDEKTGELKEKVEAPISSRPTVSGISTTSSALQQMD